MDENVAAPRVSALVVSRNCVDALRACLAALEGTAPREILEIVVVDNGSIDGSATLDSDFPSAQFLRMPKNFGLARALNIGSRTAKGEYILVLPPEVMVEPDTVSRLLARIQGHDDVGAVCPALEAHYILPGVDDLAAFYRSGVLPAGKADATDGAEIPIQFPGRGPVLFRKGFLAGMNYFDEKFGDFGPLLELAYQIRAAQKKILVLSDIRLRTSGAADPATDSTAIADRVSGAAVYVSKHFGAGAGIGFRIKAALAVLGSFNLGLFTAIVSGQKIDGNQPGA